MRKSAPVLILGLVLALAALAVFAVSRGSDYDRSPLGSKGLELWLQTKGIPVVRSDPHIAQARSKISLRIVPLSIHQGEAVTPQSDDETDGLDPENPVVEADQYALPTLIVLPKWRGIVSTEGVAGKSGLIDLADISNELDKIGYSDFGFARSETSFEEAQPQLQPGQPIKIALYRAQTFERSSLPSGCGEVVGTLSGVLLLHCAADPTVYLLSDPDLLNNHGLALADNAAFAVSLVQSLRAAGESRPIYLDTSGEPLDSEATVDEGQSYERSTTDLKRFFAYPLSAIWGTVLVVAAICFWRGAYRFGPPLREVSGNIELSKTAAIEATARLLRLSGNDGRMTGQFVLHLLADKAQLLFGSGAGNQAGIARLFQRLARQDKAAAQALHAAAEALIERGHIMTRSDLHRNLETFRKLLGSFEFGSR
ncbi:MULTISPECIES: DUF4350 domain-containing protein [Rhizobium]|uniref:DUF4350 domain-containing protein n=1 Tax=Rhizobium TaxID=379 RepID=UPI0007EA5DA4|nr:MULTISPECIES: hypothetical protein [Rhizobium]ANK94470.1 hypothetical protein AMK01_PC00054 [Rhizobium sp. N6212]ANL00520.1 hypothetical protein AMK00_PC00054 [Rhizobium sp. N621]ANL06641.1 hypothetical protein AMJ99_PC00054 [Rhizobium esperanzae]ANL12812.1 hypothetical protein AMJ98_PD00054 [Rhizobium sp. N1341]ANM37485.1 hypothetical protein AMK04_PC00054 [Rhizobium sp. N871]